MTLQKFGILAVVALAACGPDRRRPGWDDDGTPSGSDAGARDGGLLDGGLLDGGDGRDAGPGDPRDAGPGDGGPGGPDGGGGCESDGDCPRGTVCERRQCRAGCLVDDECALGKRCDVRARACVEGCSGDARCPKEQVCTDGRCAPGCRDDARCETGRICDAQTLACRAGCRADEDCPLEQKCSPWEFVCQEGCSGDARCRPGRLCNSGFCADPCYADAACELQHVCEDRRCVLGCHDQTARCPAGLACVAYAGTSSCQKHCEGAYACAGAGWECYLQLDGFGQPRTSYSICRQRCRSDADCDDPDHVCATFFRDGRNPAGTQVRYCGRPCYYQSSRCTYTRAPTGTATCECGMADGLCRTSAGTECLVTTETW